MALAQEFTDVPKKKLILVTDKIIEFQKIRASSYC
ncbi:MAG: hypothetical protein ACJAWH_000254 [Maribacter sp.]|jgi:hypothetical protein